MSICIFCSRLACRCAIESGYKEYTHFGLQFYGECWSGPHAAEVFPTYGESKKCVGVRYDPCDDQSRSECVGGARMNYIYRIVGPDLGKNKMHKCLPKIAVVML